MGSKDDIDEWPALQPSLDGGLTFQLKFIKQEE